MGAVTVAFGGPLHLGDVTFGPYHMRAITSERRSVWAPFRLRAVTFVGRYILDAFTSGRRLKAWSLPALHSQPPRPGRGSDG